VLEQKAIHGVGQVAPDLKHPGLTRFVHDARDLDTPAREVDDKENVVANEAGPRDSFDGEEVHGGDDAQCARKNALHDSRLARSGAGCKPASSRMRLIVLRPMSWPMLLRAPRIRV
jgi:hypothetical protein